MRKKNILTLLLVGFLVLFLTACEDDNGNDTTEDTDNDAVEAVEDDEDNGNDEQPTGDGAFVGISMPTQSSARWVDDGNNLVEQLEALGYQTTLQYAEDIVENQVAQIENMIAQGVDVLVIAAVDGGSLTTVLQQAAAADIYVIAYDRLIMDSEHVSYYATFDNFYVGVMQGQFILDDLGISDGETGPFNIELFGGSSDDNNAWFFFDGAMSVLQPYIDNGTLVIQSGQDTMEQVATLRWDGAAAQDRMENLLSAFYGDERVDAVLAPYDGLSLGIISALRGVGYGSGDLDWPTITGQDALIPAIISIKAGEQTQTIFKDTRDLAARTVDMIDALLSGQPATVNDTETYDNNVIIVPTYLLEPVQVDINNWYEVLVESGYYTLDELE